MSSPPVGTVANQTSRDLGLLPTAPAPVDWPFKTSELQVTEMFQDQAARIQQEILAMMLPEEMLGPDRSPTFTLFNYRKDDIRFFGRAGRK
jgi:hypothetical protein